MTRRVLALVAMAYAVGIVTLMARPTGDQATAKSTHSLESTSAWVVPRTPDGQPDLQGVWDYRTATPLERPNQYADKEFLSEDDVAEFELRRALRPDGRPPEDERVAPSVHPPWWLDYGTTVVGTRRSSLVIDPPDGRIPSLTPAAKARMAERRAARARRGPADSWEDRSLWERCLTRGLPEGMLPGAYNNNLQLFQARDYVVIVSEMIHDARIVPLDGRPHVAPHLQQWLGDGRGHWEGDTLVVETSNFHANANFRGAGAHLRLIERFTRTDENTIDYRFTVEDDTTWVSSWTVAFPLVRSEAKVYEYACHEGNYGLRNILANARTAEGAVEQRGAH